MYVPRYSQVYRIADLLDDRSAVVRLYIVQRLRRNIPPSASPMGAITCLRNTALA